MTADADATEVRRHEEHLRRCLRSGVCAAAPARPRPARKTTRRNRRDPAGDDDDEGDTGLWFVPTGEILPARKWSFSVYRVNFDYEQGFTDVSNWPVTFGVGLGDRAELFGAFTSCGASIATCGRSSRATRESGGVVNDYPFVRQGWTGNQLGDLWLGAKINLIVAVARSEQPAGLRAARHGQAADRAG